MKAVMYGAGNIGRGFIGMLLSRSGYDVAFVDVVEATVEAINRDKCYPVRIVSSEGYEEIEVKNVSAVNGRDEDAVAEAIAQADVMATAVGVNIMKFIAPVIAKGLRRRFEQGKAPFNIIICENLIDANKVLEDMLKKDMTDEEKTWFDQNVGLVEASIGRMVPVQTDEMRCGNPLRVCVERYGFLPVDKDAFRGNVPAIDHMIPFAPFDYFIRRKLYVHNMGHATCAYLGMLKGSEYIYQSIADPEVRLICQSAMTESAIALAKTYGVDVSAILDHVFDLLVRFENKALMDTCARVGGDTVRKLHGTDRMIGSAQLCLRHGVTPAFIALGAAAAVRAHITQNGLEDSVDSAIAVLKALSGLEKEEKLTLMIARMYEKIASGATIADLRAFADRARVEASGAIV
ncbi:MAG: mannitol dehydrogenase [Clostridia bacterium]